MLDPKIIRKDLDAVVKQLARRGFEVDTNKLHALEEARKEIQGRTQSLQNERNTRSKAIGKALNAGSSPTTFTRLEKVPPTLILKFDIY